MSGTSRREVMSFGACLTLRPWVLTSEGRDARVEQFLECAPFGRREQEPLESAPSAGDTSGTRQVVLPGDRAVLLPEQLHHVAALGDDAARIAD
jgi:hypothetical protein